MFAFTSNLFGSNSLLLRFNLNLFKPNSYLFKPNSFLFLFLFHSSSFVPNSIMFLFGPNSLMVRHLHLFGLNLSIFRPNPPMCALNVGLFGHNSPLYGPIHLC